MPDLVQGRWSYVIDVALTIGPEIMAGVGEIRATWTSVHALTRAR
jgi:hypothetical protein